MDLKLFLKIYLLIQVPFTNLIHATHDTIELPSLELSTFTINSQSKLYDYFLHELNKIFNQNSEIINNEEDFSAYGVLRHQIAYKIIDVMLKNQINCSKIPNALETIEDVLYRSIVHTSLSKVRKLNHAELLKKLIHHQETTCKIDESKDIPKAISDILAHDYKNLSTKLTWQNDKFNYPAGPHFETRIYIKNNEIIKNLTSNSDDDFITLEGKTCTIGKIDTAAIFIFLFLLIGFSVWMGQH